MTRTIACLVAACGICAACAALAAGGAASQGAASRAAGRGEPASASAPASQAAGLAAKYDDDRGIDRDPDVILHEDFEGADFDARRWSEIKGAKTGALKLVGGAADVYGGKQSLRVTATLGQDTGGHLFKRFERGYEQLYARLAVKFADDCDYIHHFVRMNAELPATRWPQGEAGVLPYASGTNKRFTCAIEPWGRWGKYPPPGGWHFYCYWWKMKGSKDGKYWGNDFAPEAYAVPERGRWYCIEFMCKANTPGKDDGQCAFWVDGKELAHHTNINWRPEASLQLNAFWLLHYVTENSTKNKVNTVWFDDVVVATRYIGPSNRPPRAATARQSP